MILGKRLRRLAIFFFLMMALLWPSSVWVEKNPNFKSGEKSTPALFVWIDNYAEKKDLNRIFFDFLMKGVPASFEIISGAEDWRKSPDVMIGVNADFLHEEGLASQYNLTYAYYTDKVVAIGRGGHRTVLNSRQIDVQDMAIPSSANLMLKPIVSWLRLERPDVRLHETASPEDALRMLREKQADLVLMQDSVARPLLAEADEDIEVVGGLPGWVMQLAIAVRNDHPDLFNTLNEKTHSMRVSEQKELILDWKREMGMVSLSTFTGLSRQFESLMLVLLCIFLISIFLMKGFYRLFSLARESKKKNDNLAGAAHDVKNLMQVIMGGGEILASSVKGYRERKIIDSMQKSSRAIAELMSDLLDDNRIASERQKEVDINLLVSDVVEAFEAAAENKGIALRFESEMENGCLVRIEILSFRKILFNLLANAIKFTSAGGVTVSLRLIASDGIQLAVEDTGPGISEQDLKSIFARNWKTNEDNENGHGLGLSIVKRLSNENGWVCECESELGKGSRFFISIQAEVSKSAKRERLSAGALRGMKILLVEDDEAVAQILSTQLASLGAVVVCQSTGEGAISGYDENDDLDMVLLDNQLSDMSGNEVCECMRMLDEHKERKRTVILSISGDARMKNPETLERYGFDGYVGKPLDAEALLTFCGKAAGNAPLVETAPDWMALAVDSLGRDWPVLKSAVARGDRDASRFLAHKMSGVAAMLQSKELSALLEQVDDVDADGRWLTEVEAVVDKMRNSR
ncbi:hypothetical protein CEK28_17885 [Xenophilus sp. AP218F]|nr:hypothetical protein CEK28_17885 [Xenophilus sp. AP218F]